MKVVQIGCGKMSAYCMRYVLDRGGEIVGAYDVSEKIVGKDISAVIGSQEKHGVTIEHVDNLDKSLKACTPDIAIITTQSLISSIYPVLEILAQNQVNAVSICEELFYAWDSNPVARRRAEYGRV
ncbi:MAG: hypothetical protein CSA13_02270 [Clostridiales bacterium]|nr:MAG: hypothetical protein CSA13_02270 [Clostridiales bacterium]